MQGTLMQGILTQGTLMQDILTQGTLMQGILLQGTLMQVVLTQGTLMQGILMQSTCLSSGMLSRPLMLGCRMSSSGACGWAASLSYPTSSMALIPPEEASHRQQSGQSTRASHKPVIDSSHIRHK